MNAIDIDEAKFVQFCSNLTMVCVVDLTSLVCFVFAFCGWYWHWHWHWHRHVVCYHYETRTRHVRHQDSDSNVTYRTEHYREEVVTHTATDYIEYDYW